MRATEFTIESDTYQPPKLSVGDTILKGKFKNSKAEIKGFTKDKHNQPVLKTNKGEVQLFKPRITKLMQEEVSPIFDPNTALEETAVSGTGSSPHSWTGDELYRKLVELEDIDEGWKDWAAAATIGAAALAPQFGSKPIEPTVKPAITQPAQAAPQKKQIIAAPSKNPQIESIVSNAAKKEGMKGAELAQFMAQVKHESWDFSRLKEKGQPYVKDYFKKKYDPNLAPKTAKILGNIHKGDGDKYKGRGFIQLTGRDNYRMAGNALNLPLLVKPELASNPEVAAKIAIWYWNTRVKPHVNNFNDTAAVTKKINSSMHGLESREANFMAYLEKKVIGKPA